MLLVLILGLDWIIKSLNNLMPDYDKIVLKSSESITTKKKKVRFTEYKKNVTS